MQSGAIGSFVLPAAPAVARPAAAAPASAGSSFGSMFQAAAGSVEGLRQSAETQLNQFLNGEGGELHNTVLAAQKAELAFDLFLQVRNKVVQAYQEVMRMQI